MAQPRQRKDATRNRERVAAAAADLLAERGLVASLKDVACRAGVGIGTVYRHVPDREALIVDLITPQLDELAGRLARARATDDPVQGLRDFLGDLWGLLAGSRALQEIVIDPRPLPAALGSKVADLLAGVVPLLSAAQETGRVRPDVDVNDIIVMVSAMHAAATLHEYQPEAPDRLRTILLDGLMTSRAEPTAMDARRSEPTPLVEDAAGADRVSP